MYPEELVKPMRQDLAGAGFEELYTSEAVVNALKGQGTTLVVVNSVSARRILMPAVIRGNMK